MRNLAQPARRAIPRLCFLAIPLLAFAAPCGGELCADFETKGLAVSGSGRADSGIPIFELSVGLREGRDVLRGAFRASLAGPEARLGFAGRGLVVGPGRMTGPLRLLADPTACGSGFTSGAIDLKAAPGDGAGLPPLALDGALRSGLSVAALAVQRALPVAGVGCVIGASAFALAEGHSGGFLLGAQGASASEVTPEDERAAQDGGEVPGFPEAVAGGLSLYVAAGEGGLSLLSVAHRRASYAGGGGWHPVPLPQAASTGLALALVAERRTACGFAAFGLGASLEEAGAPGLALRLEAQTRFGSSSVRAFASLASEQFRGILGESSRRRFAAGLDLRRALRRAAQLSVSARLVAEAPRPPDGRPEGAFLATPWIGPSLAIAARLPFVGDFVALEPRFEFEHASILAPPSWAAVLGVATTSSAPFGFRLAVKASRPSNEASQSYALECAFCTRRGLRRPVFDGGLRISGKAEVPGCLGPQDLRANLGLKLPLRGGVSVELGARLELPRHLSQAETATSLAFSAAYRATF